MEDFVTAAQLLSSQPGPVRAAFPYYLALKLVEEGIIQPIQAVVGDTCTLCIFEAFDGQRIAIIKPDLSGEEIVQARQVANTIFNNEQPFSAAFYV